MTPEQITSLAKQVGGTVMHPFDYGAKPDRMMMRFESLQRFAELVRNAALDEAAKAVDKMADDKSATQMQRFALDLASDTIRDLK